MDRDLAAGEDHHLGYSRKAVWNEDTMNICPICRSEYGDGFVLCSECNTPVVALRDGQNHFDGKKNTDLYSVQNWKPLGGINGLGTGQLGGRKALFLLNVVGNSFWV